MLLCRCFDKIEHAEEFLSGRIRMMSLKYYREKETDKNGRKDKYEGALKLWQGEHTTVKIDGMVVSGKEGLVSVVTRLDEHEKNTKICCCTLLEIEDNEIKAGALKQFKLPYCVLFSKPNEFIDRFKKAAKDKNWAIGKTTFYDEKTYNGDLNEFQKPQKFAWQNEFRLSLKESSHDPFYLDIGDIHEIAEVFKTRELIKKLAVAEIHMDQQSK